MLTRKFSVVAFAGCAAVLAGLPAAAQERAGETLRVQPSSYQRTGAYPFNLNRGDEIYRNANVYTEQYGSVRMLFDDGTDMTLGPNTDIVIDEYVYSPDGGSGQAAISLGQGVLRMVSGRMPSAGISIDTPVATIGVRGTTFTLAIAAPGVRGWVDDGTVTAAPDQGTQTFAFAAPAAFACSASSCEQADGQEPPPAAFPAAPPGGGFGIGPGDASDPAGEDGGGHDSQGGSPGID